MSRIQDLSILQFPNQQSRNNDFSVPWVRGGEARKTLDLLRVKTIFSLRSDLKKDQQLEHKAVYDFFFSLRRAME